MKISDNNNGSNEEMILIKKIIIIMIAIVIITTVFIKLSSVSLLLMSLSEIFLYLHLKLMMSSFSSPKCS